MSSNILDQKTLCHLLIQRTLSQLLDLKLGLSVPAYFGFPLKAICGNKKIEREYNPSFLRMWVFNCKFYAFRFLGEVAFIIIAIILWLHSVFKALHYYVMELVNDNQKSGKRKEKITPLPKIRMIYLCFSLNFSMVRYHMNSFLAFWLRSNVDHTWIQKRKFTILQTQLQGMMMDTQKLHEMAPKCSPNKGNADIDEAKWRVGTKWLHEF